MNRRAFLAGVCLFASVFVPSLRADDDRDDDRDAIYLYTMTNGAAANSVMVYRRMPGGSLSPVGPVATGGKGNGAGLGSQGALVLTSTKRWLLAANAGSDDVSVFRATESGIRLVSRTPSGGHMPISVTVSGRIVYVLNAGAPNSIAGFTLGSDGSLTPIPNSVRGLSGTTVGPAQVQFSHEGDQLVVTEKGTNLIDVFPVGANGVPGPHVTTPSYGMTPFGFSFGRNDRLFVSEAFGGTPNASAASSYNVDDAGSLHLITGSVSTRQTAACWLVIDPSGRFAYTTNTGSRTVSVFRIGSNGSLTLVSSTAATPAGGPIDASFSGNGRFLHVLTANGATIVTFRIQADGNLMMVNTIAAPPAAAGLAAQ